MWEIIAPGVAVALIAAVVNLAMLFGGRALQKAQTKKALVDVDVSDATAGKTITEAALALMEPLEKQMRAYHAEVVYLRNGLAILVRQMSSAGMTPEWVPDPFKVFDGTN